MTNGSHVNAAADLYEIWYTTVNKLQLLAKVLRVRPIRLRKSFIHLYNDNIGHKFVNV